MNPKISVVIPVYNGELFIEKAIHSVMTQDYPAHEVIIIDDGSTDSTPEILESFKGRITARRIQNSGASNARNVGMDLATGDYVAFLDADDIWFKRKLKKHVEMIQKYPEAGFVCSNYVLRVPYFDNHLTRHFSHLKVHSQLNFNAPLKVDPFRVLVQEHFVGTPSTVMIKKAVVDQAGRYSDDHRPSEDYEYWLRCALLTRFLVMDEVLVYKRTHGKNLSNDKIRTHLALRKGLIDRIAASQPHIHAHRLSSFCADAVAECDYQLGNLYFESGNIQKAYRAYTEGLAANKTPLNTMRFFMIIFKKSMRKLLELLLRGPTKDKRPFLRSGY